MLHVKSNNASKRRYSQGFTIIEILIVLAIIALILAIVFLAVPALQRNERNAARKHDAYLLLAAVDNCLADNAGIEANCMQPSNINLSVKELSIFTGFHFGSSPPANPADCGPYGKLPQCPPSLTQMTWRFNQQCDQSGYGFGAVLNRAELVGWVGENGDGSSSYHCIGDTN